MRTRTAKWYETTVRYERSKGDENNIATEAYAVDALSFAEAEQRITEEMEPYCSGEFDVKKITIAPYAEVFFSEDEDDDKFFRATDAMITLDERTGKEKKNNVNYLVQASSLPMAVNHIDEVMGSTQIDYVIASVAETMIMDVYEHNSAKKTVARNDVPEYAEPLNTEHNEGEQA